MTPQSEIGEITQILSEWNEARDACFEDLFPKVYGRLKSIAKAARRRMGRFNPGETLSTTSLVNEVYFHLRKAETLTFKKRGEFFSLCLVMMRRILLDYYVKRISKTRTEAFTEEHELQSSELVNLPFLSGPEHSRFNELEVVVIVNELLSKLAEEHPRKAEVLNLKYFFGATFSEIAKCLELKERTIRRDCTLGEVIIKRELEKRFDAPGDSQKFLADLKTRREIQSDTS